MANTTITLTQEGGVIIPSGDAVPVVQGDTIEFVGPTDSPSVLTFTPDAISALSPSPASPLQLAPSEQVSFAFSTSNPGAYSILFSQQPGPAPQIPTGNATSLFFQIWGAEAAPPPMAVAGGRTRDAQG